MNGGRWTVERAADLKHGRRGVREVGGAPVRQDVELQVVGQRHVRAAVEAVLDADRSARITLPRQVPHGNTARFDGTAYHIPAQKEVSL